MLRSGVPVNYHVEIASSKDGGRWQTIASGDWIPGSDLVLQGDTKVPDTVLVDLMNTETTGLDHGASHAQDGYVRYKMSFVVQLKDGPAT